jgi:hypothetical protein
MAVTRSICKLTKVSGCLQATAENCLGRKKNGHLKHQLACYMILQSNAWQATENN